MCSPVKSHSFARGLHLRLVLDLPVLEFLEPPLGLVQLLVRGVQLVEWGAHDRIVRLLGAAYVTALAPDRAPYRFDPGTATDVATEIGGPPEAAARSVLDDEHCDQVVDLRGPQVAAHLDRALVAPARLLLQGVEDALRHADRLRLRLRPARGAGGERVGPWGHVGEGVLARDTGRRRAPRVRHDDRLPPGDRPRSAGRARGARRSPIRS